MKAVLISIRPKWCEKITSGEKTMEIRKTRPKLEPPFKAYIYCTKNTKKNALHTYIRSGYGRKKFGIIEQWRSGKEVVDVNAHLPAYRYNAYLAEGKVIGEFVCDAIMSHCEMANADIAEYQGRIKREKLFEYANGRELFGWHISDLVIYEKPRSVGEFCKPCDPDPQCDCRYCITHGRSPSKIVHAPQSWCYVEEVQT